MAAALPHPTQKDKGTQAWSKLVGSWIALAGYALAAAMMKYGALDQVNTTLREVTVPVTTIHYSLGISSWLLVALLVAVVALLARRELKRSTPMASLPPQRTGLAHLLFEKRWHPFMTAGLIGLIAIAAYPLSFASGREAGLGITTPSAT